MNTKPYYLRKDENECQCVSMGLEETHQERYECKQCQKCCADEAMIAESNDTCDDKGKCLQCCLDEGMKLEELAHIVSRRY